MTDKLEELIERLEGWATKARLYTGERGELSRDIEAAITALREMQEREAAPLPEEVTGLCQELQALGGEYYQHSPMYNKAADLIERLQRALDACLWHSEEDEKEISYLQQRIDELEAELTVIDDLNQLAEKLETAKDLAERQRDAALKLIDGMDVMDGEGYYAKQAKRIRGMK